MKFAAFFCGLLFALPMVSQQPSASSLEVSLRCAGVETTPQSRAVKSAAYGFGNPTHPEDDEFTKHVGRVVLIEFHSGSGRIYLPKAVLAVIAHPVAEGWFPIEHITADPDSIRGSVKLTEGGQNLHIDRRTGAAELVGYGPQPLKGNCRVDRKPQQF
jgi:hypothetical protein